MYNPCSRTLIGSLKGALQALLITTHEPPSRSKKTQTPGAAVLLCLRNDLRRRLAVRSFEGFVSREVDIICYNIHYSILRHVIKRRCHANIPCNIAGDPASCMMSFIMPTTVNHIHRQPFVAGRSSTGGRFYSS